MGDGVGSERKGRNFQRSLRGIPVIQTFGGKGGGADSKKEPDIF